MNIDRICLCNYNMIFDRISTIFPPFNANILLSPSKTHWGEGEYNRTNSEQQLPFRSSLVVKKSLTYHVNRPFLCGTNPNTALLDFATTKTRDIKTTRKWIFTSRTLHLCETWNTITTIRTPLQEEGPCVDRWQGISPKQTTDVQTQSAIKLGAQK